VPVAMGRDAFSFTHNLSYVGVDGFEEGTEPRLADVVSPQGHHDMSI
jgi:hypothetical protein